MRILVVEDDALLGDGIQVGLQQQHFVVDWVRMSADAETMLSTQAYAALVLDWNLPGYSGIDFLKRLRAQGKTLPVLMLTARDTVRDRIEGLNAGADDYLVKPFDLGELAARLRALVRRASGTATGTLRIGALQLDPAAHSVIFREQAVELQAREFALLQQFMLNAGRVLSRAQLEANLYSLGQELASNAIDVYIHHLRKKICANAIQTLRGVGYLMPKAIV